ELQNRSKHRPQLAKSQPKGPLTRVALSPSPARVKTSAWRKCWVAESARKPLPQIARLRPRKSSIKLIRGVVGRPATAEGGFRHQAFVRLSGLRQNREGHEFTRAEQAVYQGMTSVLPMRAK